MVRENLETVEANIRKACANAGRSRDEVTLIAVSKTKPVSMLEEIYAEGIRTFGENKVQEILDKYDKVLPVRWHMIGHLQTNKVKYIIDKVCLIHSVDSFRLAEEINRRAAQHGIVMDILVQVNAACDEAKFGVDMDAAEILVREILENCSSIRVRGLMTIAPYAENPEEIRPYFHQMRQLYDRLARDISHPSMDFKYLSMGMSNDRVVAVEEGSTVIRVGTAIFGARSYT